MKRIPGKDVTNVSPIIVSELVRQEFGKGRRALDLAVNLLVQEIPSHIRVRGLRTNRRSTAL
jgi:hypothetical protein